MTAGGHRLWYVPDGYLPPESTGEYESHEAICVLNVGAEDAGVEVTFYFEDRDPLEASFTVPAHRTRHVRTDDADTLGVTLPRGVTYAYRVRASAPVVVQHSRLDTTQPAYALFTTIGYWETR